MTKYEVKRIINFFIDDEIAFYSAGMSFYLIFAAIPVLFLMITVLTFLPLFDDLYSQFQLFLTHHMLPESQQELSTYLAHFLEGSTRLGWVGGASLIVAAGLFFLNFDTAIQRIMRTQPRPPHTTVALYLGVLILSPIAITGWIFLSAIAPESYLPSWLTLPIPYAWLEMATLFYLSYRILPARPINSRAALVAALVASGAFEIAKMGFVYYVRYTTSYTLYGSFAAILFFFLWLYLSWQIYFFGLKLCRILAIPIPHYNKEQSQESDCHECSPFFDSQKGEDGIENQKP